jgi:hypothetical protein
VLSPRNGGIACGEYSGNETDVNVLSTNKNRQNADKVNYVAVYTLLRQRIVTWRVQIYTVFSSLNEEPILWRIPKE